MTFKSAVLSVVACALAACTAPMTYPNGPTMQMRANWVRDWDHLADEAAFDFMSRCQCDRSTVFVMARQPQLPFANAYRKLLEEKLLGRGATVSESAVRARTILTFDVQTFLYDHTGRILPAAWIPVGAALDSIVSLYDVSKAEVLLTLSVSDNGLLRYRRTTEFYTRPSDLAEFYEAANDSPGGHCLNGNCASGILAGWPEAWDLPAADPALDTLPGRERKMAPRTN
jgi:hypothetical protein